MVNVYTHSLETVNKRINRDTGAKHCLIHHKRNNNNTNNNISKQQYQNYSEKLNKISANCYKYAERKRCIRTVFDNLLTTTKGSVKTKRNTMKNYATLAILSCALFAAVLLLANDTAATNSTWGYIGYYDRLLYRGQVVKKSEWLRVVTYNFSYPAKNQHNPYFISAVRAIDHKRKDGGYAQLRQGGPGSRNVTLYFKSDRNHGLNYTVEIYGK